MPSSPSSPSSTASPSTLPTSSFTPRTKAKLEPEERERIYRVFRGLNPEQPSPMSEVFAQMIERLQSSAEDSTKREVLQQILAIPPDTPSRPDCW